MDKARIGVIGVGWWGTYGHLEPLAQDDRAEVAAVWSRTEDKAAQRAAQFGVPRHYTDYRRMIDECDLDGVVIASTPNMHFEQARYALSHGLHVLMEKPFVLKAEHANTLERLAHEQNRLLGVCHPLIFTPTMAAAREIVRSGRLGNLLLVSALFSQRVIDLYRGDVPGMFDRRAEDRPRPNAASYSDPAVVGGGEGHTQASHITGMMLWLTGLQPQSVFAYMNCLDTAVDVVDAMTVRFTNGALATITANGMLPPRVGAQHLQIQGDQGVLNYDSLGRALYLFTGEDPAPQRVETPAPPEGYNSVHAVPRNFVRAILGQEPLYVETEVALNEARILDAAYRSVESGQPEEIIR